MSKENLVRWHQLLDSRDPQQLNALVADNAVFHSPLVHRPQEGKALTIAYLSAALQVLANDSFHYVREVNEGAHSLLEFMVELDGITVNGIDMIEWDPDGKIIDFKVMIRPYKAIEIVRTRMATMLGKLK